ncbi:hypothetical protein MASR2M12_02170 [Bacteroidales bacterium]
MPSYKPILKADTILKILLTGCFIFFVSNKGTAQYSISGTIEGYEQKPVSLLLVRGDMRLPVDSARTDKNGNFRLEAKSWYQPGMFELKLQDGFRIPLIYNRQNIRFVSDAPDEEAVIRFIESDENKVWHDYIIAKNRTKALQDVLKPVLQQYPSHEIFYRQTVDEFNKLQNNLKQKTDSLFSHHSELLSARFIRADAPAIANLGLDFEQQRADLLAHFFDQCDFADTTLIASDILSRKMIDFLALHQTPQMNIHEIQAAFIRGLDVIMEKASVENKTYLFVLSYFIDGFARMGLSEITDYLSTLPHLKSDCLDLPTLMEIEQVAGPHRRIITGSAAPVLLPNTINGEPFSLEQLQGKLKILVFWSVSCQHCLKMLPELKMLSAEFPEVRIISFVISNDRPKLDEIIQSEQLYWIHLTDGLMWESPVVQSYMVYGTPTLFLLNEENHIMAKPVSIEETQSLLEQHFHSKK